MKKMILGIIAVIILLFAVSYGLMFTQPGNNLLRPTIEAKINKTLKTKMKLVQFSLRPSFILMKLKTPADSVFVMSGKFGLFSKEVDVKYFLGVSRKEKSFAFKTMKLKGPFWVKGTAKGIVKSNLIISGKSNFASSDITYNISLNNLKPVSIVAHAADLKLENLLRVLNKPAFANGVIKADIKIDSLKKNNLGGTAVIYVKNGTLNNRVMKTVYKINMPKTTFDAFSKISLKSSAVDFLAKINSNLGKSSINGTFNQKNSDIKAAYNINLNELGLLKPLMNLDLRGSFSTNGTAEGNRNVMYITGKSNAADSSTSYKVTLKDYKPVDIILSSKNAHLDKVLYLINKPVYAYGLINADIKMTGISDKHLNGNFDINLSKGAINQKVIKTMFNINMPKTTFKANAASTIKDSVFVSKINIDSSIASLSAQKAVFRLAKMTLNSDYKLYIPNLDKLYFISNRHLRGSSTITGNITYDKNLTATAYSKMWDGEIHAKLKNNIIKGSAKNIQVVKLTDMMMYNRIFDSKGNMDFSYNLLSKQGIVKAKFINGRILPNRVTFLLHNMAKFNITREIYRTTTINSRINDKKIISDLDMISRLTHITSKNALIDLNKNTIDAKISVGIKKSVVYVKLRGNINHPRIKFDFKNLIRHKAEKKIKKILKGFFK